MKNQVKFNHLYNFRMIYLWMHKDKNKKNKSRQEKNWKNLKNFDILKFKFFQEKKKILL